MTTLFQTLFAMTVTLGDRVSDRVAALKDDERGASAVEYALLVGAIAAAVVTAVALFGDRLGNLFNTVNITGRP